MCGGGVCCILLLPLVARCLETRDVYLYCICLFLCLLLFAINRFDVKSLKVLVVEVDDLAN